MKELAKPFPKQFLGKDDRGNDAVDHTVVTQRLLEIFGDYGMKVVEVLRSEVAGMTTRSGKEHPGGTFVTGVIIRLTLPGMLPVEEVGGVENAAMKDGDGERLKHAISDAIKRASMRKSLGLHMWAQDHYYLDKSLAKRDQVSSVEAEVAPAVSVSPTGAPDPQDESPAEPDAEVVGEGEAPATSAEGMTPAMISKVHTILGKANVPYEETFKEYLTSLGKPSLSKMTKDQGSKLIDWLESEGGKRKLQGMAADFVSPYELAKSKGIDAVGFIAKAKELAAPLKANVPARPSDVVPGSCHPGLYDAILAWVLEPTEEEAA